MARFVDTQVLERLSAFQQNECAHPAAEMIDLFLSVAPSMVFELRDLWKKSDWLEMQEQSERFRLSALSVGAKTMAEICQTIIDAAAVKPDDLKPLIEDLFMVYTYVELELNTFNRHLLRLEVQSP